MNLAMTDKIIAFLNATGSSTVEAYVRYQLVNAEMWLWFAAFCVLLVALCVGAVIWRVSVNDDDDGPAAFFAIAGFVLLFIAGITVAQNLPTVRAPRAAAIHQLISDIRGG